MVDYKTQKGEKLFMKKLLLKIFPTICAVALLNSQKLLAFNTVSLKDRVSNQTEKSFEMAVNSTKKLMFLTSDSDILSDSSTVSSVIERDSKGSPVYIIGIDGEMCQVLTSSGKTGYISVSRLTDDKAYLFNETDEIKYTVEGAEVKKLPSDDSTTVSVLPLNTEIHLCGTNDGAYWQIEIDGGTYYMKRESILDAQQVIVQPVAFTEPQAAYNGEVLTPSKGKIMGPSGKETYYNLNMMGCVARAHASGIQGDYWVREDGVKMLGDYVMVAANLSIRPLGSLVDTSLGTGIVVDTGTFAYNNLTQIDIAVAW